ncbi:hypothetical protein JWG45_10795 [Leptospira sp. 201903070]|uniref:YcxB family protein n=1 Tax=Leptospira ainlahdjerensis TaxID=2810033 RepID=A0ABS2UFJ3_9LEPT|nr:hypothetical protein [Leptospira ainlahdjerensis]MBM9577640.1 hypothetical protein [Leptospira ainlahdjerensis]
MEYSLSLDIQKQKRNFLFGYYNRPIFWFQRKFLPFVLLALSVLDFFLFKNAERFIVPLFFGILSLYFIARPFILLKRIRFQDLNGKIFVSENGLKISDDKGEFKILPEELLKIIPKKHYLFLKVRIHMVQYLLIDLNSIQGDSKEFVKELEALFYRKGA